MSAVKELTDQFQKKVNEFRGDTRTAKKWKENYARMELAFKLDGLVARGLGVLRYLLSMDSALRSRIFAGEMEYSGEFETALDNSLQMWRDASGEALKQIGVVEESGLKVSRSEELRAAMREVNGMLADPAEFFSGNALVDLRDDAIDADRAGETVGMERFGD